MYIVVPILYVRILINDINIIDNSTIFRKSDDNKLRKSGFGRSRVSVIDK